MGKQWGKVLHLPQYDTERICLGRWNKFEELMDAYMVIPP